jgi:hypothetical protein
MMSQRRQTDRGGGGPTAQFVVSPKAVCGVGGVGGMMMSAHAVTEVHGHPDSSGGSG